MTNDFVFGGITLNTSKKLINKIMEDSLLHEKSDVNSKGNVLFLLDLKPSPGELKAFLTWLDKLLPMYNYKVVLASTINASDEDMKKEGYARFFRKNGVDIAKYSYESQVVVPVGRALYAITKATDISTSCFYDYVFNSTSFYSSDLNTEVFPIDSLDRIFKVAKGGGFWIPQDSFRKNFAELQIKKIKEGYDTYSSPKRVPSLGVYLLTSRQEVLNLFEKYKSPCIASWDLETSGLDFVNDTIGCLTIAFNNREGYFIPLDYETPIVSYQEISDFLANKTQIGQNIKFDAKFSRRAYFNSHRFKTEDNKPVFRADEDTLILAQCLNENRANGLKALAYYYSPFGGYDRDLDAYIEHNHPTSYLQIPLPILSQYATKDAIVTFWVWEKMQKQLDELDAKYPPLQEGDYTFREYYEKIRMPSYRAFIGIEEKGVYVDKVVWDQSCNDVQAKILQLQADLYKKLKVQEFLASDNNGLKLAEWGQDLDDLFDGEEEDEDKNLTSNKKLGELLKWNGWPNLGEAKTGGYLTGDEQLVQWKKKGYEAAKILQQLRSYRTLQKTFVGQVDKPAGWRKYLRYHAEDNSWRIHPTYRVMGAESGRNTCDSPNWQQIPSHGEIAHYVKDFISVPNKDEYFLATLDYSSLQIRLAAIDSLDRKLAGAYREDPNADLHSITGYSVFAQGKTFEIEEVVVRDKGVEKVYLAAEEVKVMRQGEKKTIAARDLLETDQII